MKTRQLLLPLLCLLASAAHAADDTPSFKVGATIFADYTNQQTSHLSSFNVSRAYLNISGQMNHWIVFRVTPDVARETGSGSSLTGSQEFRLKYAFGQFNLDDWTTKGSWIRIGVQQTPIIDYQEGIYRYRFQGQVFVEREGYLPSSDAGVSAHYNLPHGYGDIHAGFYNGEGYSKAEVNNQKAFQLRATLRPIPARGLRVTAFVDADHYATNAVRQRIIEEVTYESPRFNAGIDHLNATDRATVSAREVSGSGWSVWATPRLTTSWELLLRHDDTKPDDTTSQRRTRNIAGVAYWFPGLQKVSSAILVDYDSLTQKNYAPAKPKDTRYGVKMLISF